MDVGANGSHRPGLRVADFDFDLPAEQIALRPVVPRTAARLLVATAETRTDSTVGELPRWLRAGDVLVFNDTAVLPVRLTGQRERSNGWARIEVTLIRELGDGGWQALARPLARLRKGDLVTFGPDLQAMVEGIADGRVTLCFQQHGPEFHAALTEHGQMPLPPYIAKARKPDAQDHVDYQTVYARVPGAVAAPTAGLHFDDTLLAAIDAQGVTRVTVTLHVGGGTFLPVRVEQVAEHRMEPEWGVVDEIAATAIEAAHNSGGRIIAVGTTSLRLLESSAQATGYCRPWRGNTELFIHPGYQFRAVDGLLTNFHLPRSTLFMLVCAFLGMERMKSVYEYAVHAGYRFFSYGDATLLLR